MTVPTWFLELAGRLAACYPNWKVSAETIEVFWLHLNDLEPVEIHRGVAAHIMRSQFPPTVAEIRNGARPSREAIGMTAAEAWSEMYANRQRCGTRPFVALHKARWTNPAIQRAADSVDWTSPDWLTEQIPTIRAQFERYFKALAGKSEALARDVITDEILAHMTGPIGMPPRELYGPGYVDPAEDEDTETDTEDEE